MQKSINYNCIEKGFPLSGHRYSADMKKAIRDRFIDILVISIPLFSFIEFKIVGRLFMSETLLICLFPFLIFKFNNRNLLLAPLPKIMVVLLLAWLAGQVATDLIQHTPFADYIRGWAKISVTIINFSMLYILIYGSRRRIVLYAIGLALGGILKFYFNPNIYAVDYPWKFGIGGPLTWLIIIFASSRNVRWFPLRAVIVSLVSVLNLYMGFRSYSGICFLTVVYLFLQWLWNIKGTQRAKLSSKNLFLICIVILIASFIFIKGYGHMARKGLLGEKARQIYEQQSKGDLGLLIGGRSEILVSIRAIMDSPIIGHGSWAKSYRYSNTLIYLKRILGYYPSRYDDLGLIPTHSHLFGAWVEAGILGAVFWIWVISLPIRGMSKLIRTKEILTPFFAFISFLLIWDVLFSPYGAELRIMIPYYIIVTMSILPMRVKKKTCVRW
jgi:hypothetical protein